jgi:hypothetical protein
VYDIRTSAVAYTMPVTSSSDDCCKFDALMCFWGHQCMFRPLSWLYVAKFEWVTVGVHGV